MTRRCRRPRVRARERLVGVGDREVERGRRVLADGENREVELKGNSPVVVGGQEVERGRRVLEDALDDRFDVPSSSTLVEWKVDDEEVEVDQEVEVERRKREMDSIKKKILSNERRSVQWGHNLIGESSLV